MIAQATRSSCHVIVSQRSAEPVEEHSNLHDDNTMSMTVIVHGPSQAQQERGHALLLLPGATLMVLRLGRFRHPELGGAAAARRPLPCGQPGPWHARRGHSDSSLKRSSLAASNPRGGLAAVCGPEAGMDWRS